MADKKEYVKLWVSYESYFEAYSAAEVGRLVLAMIQYRVSGVEPEFSGSERFIWPAIRRDIDESLAAQEAAAEASRENGKKGGRPPKAKKPERIPENPENPAGFFETGKSHGQRTEDEGQGQGQGQGHSQGQGQRDTRARDLAVVVDAYKNKISSKPSQGSLEELMAYVDTLGAAVCLRAIDAALDAGKANWSYLRGILENKKAQGVRSLEDWDRLEQNRQRHGKGQQMPACDPKAESKQAREDMERIRRMMEEMRKKEA